MTQQQSQSSSPGGASGPARRGILQIHPSLRCNLQCAHCYSASGPRARAQLDVSTLRDVITDASSMGYDVVSVSGGEPLLYAGLPEVLAHAKSRGMVTTVTSNGALLRAPLLERLRAHLDVLALSLDGPPDVHNALRGSPRAFAELEAGIAVAAGAGVPFGFISTLTRASWMHLLWIAEFAAARGAGLLQIHPLELSGRADRMGDAAAGEEILSKVYVLAAVLAAKYSQSMRVQLDLLYRDHLRDEPELVYASGLPAQAARASAAELMGLLVMEPDGTVVPAAFGMARQYAVCNVRRQRLKDAWSLYQQQRYPAFRNLCHSVFARLCAPDAPLLTNWHAEIVAASHEPAASARSAGAGVSCME